LLSADAGTCVRQFGNPPECWLDALPRYAELQHGECTQARNHVAHAVPDLRVATLPTAYEQLLRTELPVDDGAVACLRQFAPRFEQLCAELTATGVPDTMQHDDLHHNNLYARDGKLRILDWGDASISHPFMSLVVTFRFLEERNGLAPSDEWFARLRDAYLEPWGTNMRDAFAIAMRAGAIAHAIASSRQRRTIPLAARESFDDDYRVVLQRAIAATGLR
jgi:hypothetical protein